MSETLSLSGIARYSLSQAIKPKQGAMSTHTSVGHFPITRTQQPKPKPADDALSFGKVLTDHMFLMDYAEGQGWHSPRIVPYGPITMDPATTVLHYGQAIFDGLKAFRGQDGKIRLFRAQRHAERINRSA